MDTDEPDTIVSSSVPETVSPDMEDEKSENPATTGGVVAAWNGTHKMSTIYI